MVDFLTDEEATAYGRYTGAPSRADLERVFFLDDDDRALVDRHRGEHMRLGFSLQLVTVRWVGAFLEDPLDVPGVVLDFVAEQLGIADASQVKKYTERTKTRFDHQWEIRRSYGLAEFVSVEAELRAWVAARSWTSGDGPKAIFYDAVAWLRGRGVLLPGVTTLARLVSQVREDTTRRLWGALEGLLTVGQRYVLDRLLEVSPGSRVSDLEKWRKGPAPRGSGPTMIKALDQVAEVTGLGTAELGVEALVPPRRLAELARYGMSADASLIRRHGDGRRLATLLATVRHLEAKSVDDTLELLDLLMATEMLNKAQTAANKETVRRHPKLAKASARLAVAVEALFDSDSWGGPDSEPLVTQVWEAIEAVVSRADLRAALVLVNDNVPPADAADPDDWRSELVVRYTTMSGFLKLLPKVIEFGANAEGAAVLAAMKGLPDVLAYRSRLAAPLIPARTIEHSVVNGPWRRLVFGHPAHEDGAVNRHAYTFCLLEQFWRGLKRRDIYADASTKCRNPQAQLPPSLVDLRARTTAMLPRVDLPEVILEVMSWEPSLAEAFTAVSGGRSRLEDLDVSIAACLAAHSMNVGYRPIAKSGVPALERSRLSHVFQNYFRPETLAPANAPLVARQAGLSLAQAWGGGLVAAVDGMRFIVPVPAAFARPNRTFFGSKRGMTWLNAMNDQGIGRGAKVVSGTVRDSLHMVDVTFGLLELLGISYRPALADLPDQKGWRINPGADYGPLNTFARGKINLRRVRRNWEDMLRVVASIYTGTVRAYDVVTMLQRDGHPTALGEAFAAYGRAFKSLHILQFVDVDETYRRDIKHIRNLQEGRHALARKICHGRKGELYHRYERGLENQLGVLGLVLNCVVPWTTVYLDAAVRQLKAQGYPVRDEDMTHLSPFVNRHLGVHGAYNFALPDLAPDAIRDLRDPDTAEDDEEI